MNEIEILEKLQAEKDSGNNSFYNLEDIMTANQENHDNILKPLITRKFIAQKQEPLYFSNFIAQDSFHCRIDIDGSDYLADRKMKNGAFLNQKIANIIAGISVLITFLSTGFAIHFGRENLISESQITDITEEINEIEKIVSDLKILKNTEKPETKK